MLDAHRVEFERGGAEIAGFANMRVDEKIRALKSVLPEALVEHSSIYSIMSKGIHELDEETCQRFFPVMRAAVIEILEQDLQARKKAESAAVLRREISRIQSDLTG